jgi:putative ABC transport system permease protein
MSMVFLFSYLEGMKSDLTDNLHTYYSGEIQVRHRDYIKYEYLNPLHLRIQAYEEVVKEIDKNDSVDVISPRISFPAMIYKDEDTYKAMGIGLDFHLEKDYQDLTDSIVEGRLPEKGKNEMIVGIGLAGDLGIKNGDKITVLSTTMRRGSNAVTFQITGIARFPVEALNKSYLLVPLDRAQKLLRMDNSVTQIIMKLKKRADLAQITEQLNTAFEAAGRLEIEAKSWEEIGSSYSFVEMASSVYNFMALFFFILASSVIINTTMMVIYERRREIGTVSAMGMTGGEIVRLFFIEALFLSLIGSLIGVLAGSGITVPLSVTGINLGAAMEGIDVEISNRIFPVLKLKSAILVFVYSVFIAAIATIFPSVKAAKVKPVEALRNI